MPHTSLTIPVWPLTHVCTCTRTLPLHNTHTHTHTQGVIGRGEVETFTFDLPAAANGTRPFRLLLLLRMVDGDAQL
jgi:hypothetical protein